MEPRDDFDRAGASLRGRADHLARGHEADDVVRLARRRRAWRGATAGVATLAVVVGILNGLPEPSVDRIAIEPLTPSEGTPSEPAPATSEDAETATDADLDITAPPACSSEDLADAPTPGATFGTAAATSPRTVTRVPLVPSGDHAYALRDDGAAAFAVFGGTDGWRCLPSPDLTGPRVAAGGHGMVLAASSFGAARFDARTERWFDARMPDPGDEPLDVIWTGENFLVVFEATAVDTPGRVLAYDPIDHSWSELPAPPFAVNRRYHTSVLWSQGRVLLFGNWLGANNRPGSAAPHLAAYDPASGRWEQLADAPLSPQAAQAAAIGSHVVAVDYEQRSSTFDPTTGAWSEAEATGIDASECPPYLAAGESHVLMTACRNGAVLVDDSRGWMPFDGEGSLSHPTVLADGAALLWRTDDRGGTELVAVQLDQQASMLAAAVEACAAITDFATVLADTGFVGDPADESMTPQQLANAVDLVVEGTLTGEVEVANGPGPAGESYLAYELEVTEVIAGDATVGDTVRVSIAFDGDPTRSAELSRDVPAGASALVFAYEVTDAPGGWVAADGNGFAIACDGGPPLGQVGDGAAWSGLADLDALADAARR